MMSLDLSMSLHGASDWLQVYPRRRIRVRFSVGTNGTPTFLTSNAVPQLPEVNTRHRRKVEDQLRRDARHARATIILTSAP